MGRRRGYFTSPASFVSGSAALGPRKVKAVVGGADLERDDWPVEVGLARDIDPLGVVERDLAGECGVNLDVKRPGMLVAPDEGPGGVGGRRGPAA